VHRRGAHRRNPQPAPSELATQTRTTKQALNYLLGQLEQLGYLTGETDRNDQRSKRVGLTPRGHAATRAIYEIVPRSEEGARCLDGVQIL
jgi:DNA-binding MarR family transcriptional regulator